MAYEDLIASTREYMDKTWRSMVSYGMPLFYRLQERDQFVPGGIEFKQVYQAADFDSLVQEYGPNDGLRGGSKQLLKTPKWMISKMQCPVEITDDVEIMNDGAGPNEIQIVDLSKRYGDAAIKALKTTWNQRMYGCATDTEIDERHTLVQGIPSALFPPTSGVTVGSTYGGIGRTTSANREWAAADYANTYTSYTLSQAVLDGWINQVMYFNDNPTDLLILMGPTLWDALAQEFRSNQFYKGYATMAEQGFESMKYNGIEIAKDLALDRMTPTGLANFGTSNGKILHKSAVTAVGSSTSAGLFGDATYNGSSGYLGSSMVFILDLKTWHVRYYSKGGEGPFELGDFFDQSKVDNGKEVKLARAKWKGNLTCDAPNRNMARANVA